MVIHPRHFGPRLKTLLKNFPVVCILGPRQCGKTTFVKNFLKNWKYVDLEKPTDMVQVSEDPQGFLLQWGRRVIFDEAQRLPSLFPVLRSVVDEHRAKKGRFVLLGSASFNLIKNISESLAGRIGFLDMTPFHIKEVSSTKKLWFRGGYPEAFLAPSDKTRVDWFEAYTRTFIERDLNAWGIETSPALLRRLCLMLGHLHGKILNASEPARALGVTYHTVNRYIDIMENTFLVRRLLPYHVNIGKRLVKSPKIYFRDSGLLHYFLGIRKPGDLDVHPKRGDSWEGFVLEQIVEFLSLKHNIREFYFWRTTTGQEVDLVVKLGRDLIPIEIKTQLAPRRNDISGLLGFTETFSLKKSFVIHPYGESYSLGSGVTVAQLEEVLDFFG